MFKILVLLAIAYIVLKILNTRAKFAEADARREAEEQRLREEAEAEAEEEIIREEAVDVEPEVIENAAETVEDVEAVEVTESEAE
jgi:hypothetical protein